MSLISSLKNGNDIRGVAMEGVQDEPVSLTPDIASRLGYAFALFLKDRYSLSAVRIAVGHDSRLTADSLADGVSRGIRLAGAHIVRTGLSSTPSMFMLLKEEIPFADGSIMITASHLPFNRNGLKLFTPDGGLESSELDAVIRMAEEAELAEPGNPTGTETTVSYMPVYASRLVDMVRKETGEERPLEGLRIVVDAGNGAGGFYADRVIRPLGGDTTGSCYLEPDGRFPNHIPNPENGDAMRAVCKAVTDSDADFGIIFDTDVDRAGCVGKGGIRINRNRLIALVSAMLLSERPGTIVTDSVTSDGLSRFIQTRGGRHHRFKRGYKNVINEAIRLNASGEYTPLAIETSGHAAFKDNYFLDDGAYLITRLLILLGRTRAEGKSILDLIADLPEPAEADEIRPVFTDHEHFREQGQMVLNDFLSYARSLPYVRVTPDNYEGVRINLDTDHGNGWILMRMSLHDPVLPINMESEQSGGVQRMKSFLRDFLSQYPFLDTRSCF